MSTFKTLRFTALDTLFFRESRPFDAIGGSELASVFPPPPRTVLGAVRTAIGDALGADWNQFRGNVNYTLPNGRKLRDIIGYGDDLGSISLNGIWLSLNEKCLYPAPLFLRHREKKEAPFYRLRISSAVRTNVGTVRLPEAPDKKEGYRSLEGAWLTRAGLEKVLKGDIPDDGEIHKHKDLFTEEPRLGIARDNSKRTAEKSLLYQTCHIRPKSDLAIEANITGLDDLNIESRIVRLGGEGRMADITSVKRPDIPAKPEVKKDDTRGLILVLLTPARFGDGEYGWLPPGCTKPDRVNGVDVWRGKIEGVSLTLHAAVLGKAQREGGWDMAERKPRDVQSLIPSGSSYYCTVDNGDIPAAITALHGKQIGNDPKLGRGVIVCGLWNQREFCDQQGEKE